MSLASALKKTGKWILRILAVLILLLVIIWGILQTQWGKNIAKDLVVHYLKKKLKTEIAIRSIKVDWLTHLKLVGVYLEDQKKRKLGYIGSLETRYDLSNIFSSSLTISEITADSIQLNIARERNDSTFNFSFISNAFASKDQQVDTTSKPFTLALGKINLSHLQFLMNDLYGGQVIQFSLASLKTNIKKLDLQTMNIHADYLFTDAINTDIRLSGAAVNNHTPKNNSADTVASPLIFSADSIQLANTIFILQNPETQLDVYSSAAVLAAGKLVYNQQLFNLTAGRILLRDHTTAIKIKSNPTESKADTSVITSTGKPFTFFIAGINIEKNNFLFDNVAAAAIKTTAAMDYGHLKMENIEVVADSINYDGKGYSAKVNNIIFNEKSGFKLKQLKSNIRYSDTTIAFNNLALKTNNNSVQADAFISFPSLDKMMTAPAATKINAFISNSTLQLDDLFYFNPALKNNAAFRPLTGKIFFLNTKMTGTLDKLSIPTVSIKQAGLLLLASAEVYHPTDIKKFQVDLNLKQFSGTKAELLSLLPPKTIPDSFLQYIPASFTLTGLFKGGINQFYTDVRLKTSDGNIGVKGTAKNISDTKAAIYDLAISGDDIKLGKLLQDSSMNIFSGTFKIKGKGFEPATANMEYSGDIAAFDYNGYRYNNIRANGTLKQNVIDGSIHSADPNLLLNSHTTVDLNKSGQAFETNTQVENMDLLKLGFSKDSMQIKTNIVSDLHLNETGRLNGTANITATNLYFVQKNHSLDTLQLIAQDSAMRQNLLLKTPFANATVKGEFSLQDIPSAIKTIVERYYNIQGKDTVFTKRVLADISIDVHHPDVIKDFVPGLKSVTPFSLTGAINTDSSTVALYSTINKLRYQDYEIDSILLYAAHIPSREQFKNMLYGFGFKKITSPSLNMPGVSLKGDIVRGKINGKLELEDKEGKPRYQVPFTLISDPVKPRLYFSDSILINRRPWISDRSNVIYLDKNELKGSKFTLSNNDEQLSIIADTVNNSGLPLNLQFNNFRLKNISDIAVADTAFMEGSCNGNVSIKSFSNFRFTSALKIDSLKFARINAGDLTLNIKQEEGNIISADAALQGNGNDIQLKGTYNSQSGNPDLTLDVKNFNIDNAAPFTKEYLADLRGSIKGKLNITGTMEKPGIDGTIQLDSLKAVYKAFNTFIHIPSSAILFDKEGIKLQDFNFRDTSGNTGSITGSILTPDYRAYQLDMKIKAKNLEVVGPKKFPDQTAYGPARADVNLSITGTEKKMMIDGGVALAEKSQLTYVYVPEENISQGEGMIEFFDPLHPADSLIKKNKTETASSSYGMSMNIKATPSSSVVIMMDEVTGDQLQLKGNADLNVSKEPGGQLFVSGNYTLDEGVYDLSILQLIRKQFRIQKGSSITWSGDPLKGTMNITALYKIKTTAAELLTDMQASSGAGKQKMNFEVYLKLEKELLKPDISFRLDMAEQDRKLFDDMVYNRIKQINSIPAELNKQVMGLLTISHFIADNPFSSLGAGASTSLENTMYATAGQMLTRQVSNLLGSSVKQVDINLGLESAEDYTSGETKKNTNLTVDLSKSFADNRLSVYVGSAFALEGQNQNSNAVAGLAGNVILEYMLTKDGKYRVKGYRTSDNDLTLQMMVVKTGASFVVVFEFNKAKQIFQVKPQKK